MKFYLFALFLSLAFIFQSKAEVDTLVINLKNNQVVKIPVSSIQKIVFEEESITKVQDQIEQMNNLSLKGNYPNPFQEQTTIEFELASPGSVEVIIYDTHGNLIQKLEYKDCEAGKNTIHWNCLDRNNNRVPSGSYYYEVRYKNDIQTRKMIIVK